MKIVIAGGTGFLGEPLARRLAATHDVIVLTRDPSHVRAGRGVAWDPPRQGAWSADVASADVVINLAGENIAQRWTESRKARLLASRIDSTRAIVDALKSAPSHRRTLINASAVGYYGLRGDEVVDETSRRGPGFLAELVEQWEAAAREAEAVARVVLPRFGVVLDPSGGALAKMLPPFRFGVGGRIGNGRQWLSWVAREDALRLIEWAIAHDDASGVYNVTAPEPVRNRDFTRALGRALHRPAIFPIPPFVLKVMFGEMAEETLLGGQRAVPVRATADGFVFTLPTIETALQNIL
jgi:uncharacterized protein (TIGR01777 family)